VPPSAQKLDPVWTQDQIQNGAPDGLAVVDSVTHTVIDALSYEGSITRCHAARVRGTVSLVEGTPLESGGRRLEHRDPLAVPDARRSGHHNAAATGRSARR